MRLLNSLSFVIFLISFISEPCKALSQNSTVITDLESSNPLDFTTEGNSWLYKSLPCPLCSFSMPSGSSCGSAEEAQVVYGGPNGVIRDTGLNYLGRNFANTGATWTQIGLEFDFWMFTTAELPNAASIITSSLLFIRMTSNYPQITNSALISTCPTDFPTPQGSQIKFIYKYHIQSLTLISATGSPNFEVRINYEASTPVAIQSFGLRNLKIYNLQSSTNRGSQNFPCNALSTWNGVTCATCHASCQTCSGPNSGQCTACQASYYDYGNGTCLTTACSGPFVSVGTTKTCTKKCPTGFYWARNQSCVDACEEPLVESFDENGLPFCSSPCLLDSQFVYQDGTCSMICDPPLTQKIETTLKLCFNPCYTTSANLLLVYPDGSCDSICLPHLNEVTIQNVKYCKSPCLGSEFIYPNGNCKSACDSPLKTQDHHSILFCNSPCNPSDLTMYLYLDGSCDTCPTPLSQRTEQNIRYCDHPCPQDKPFLDQNGKCQETCISPSITSIKPIGKFCKLPCANEKYYFNTQSGKCTETCEYPAEAIESPLPKLCKSSLSEEEVKQVKAVADAANNANSASSTGAMIWSIISSSDSTSACLGPLAKILQYIKFMEIRFPEKVLLMMDAQSKNSEGFSTKMMSGVLKEFPSHELPRKFKVYQSSSSFFVNLWPALFTLSMILLVTVLVIVLTASTKGNARIHGILKSLKDILKWNVFLITFCGNIGDIILYTALEFQTMQFDNTEAVLSFISCLGMNTLAVLVVIKIIDVNSAIRKSQKTTQDEEHRKSIEQKWSSYRALFECYKDYSFYQQIFLFVFVIRMAVFNAVIGYLYNYPLFQASISVVTNTLMLGYLVIKRPMKKTVNLIQQIVLELVLLPFNICVLALAIMDHYEIVDIDRRRSIGEVIVYINLIVPILSLVLMAAKAIAMGFDLYKSWKQAKGKKLTGVRPNDILNITEEIQTDMSSSSPSKSFSENTQIMDLNDSRSVRSNLTMGNPRIRSLRPNFMGKNYYHQDSIPITTSQNLVMPEYQEQQSPDPMGIRQENQYFQNMMPSQINRMRINKRRDQIGVPNSPMKIKFGN